jgi:hypothetical protein
MDVIGSMPDRDPPDRLVLLTVAGKATTAEILEGFRRRGGTAGVPGMDPAAQPARLLSASAPAGGAAVGGRADGRQESAAAPAARRAGVPAVITLAYPERSRVRVPPPPRLGLVTEGGAATCRVASAATALRELPAWAAGTGIGSLGDH